MTEHDMLTHTAELLPLQDSASAEVNQNLGTPQFSLRHANQGDVEIAHKHFDLIGDDLVSPHGKGTGKPKC